MLHMSTATPFLDQYNKQMKKEKKLETNVK